MAAECGARFTRSWSSDRETQRSGIRTLSARQMIDATVEGEGRREDVGDRRIEIELEHVSGDIASVTCLCHLYVDLLHLIRGPNGWKIVNAAWRWR